MHPLYLLKWGCISWTVNSWDASSLFMEGRMHFMNCQLVVCILSIYGSEDAFHELSTREMHPLNLWEGECISWTVNSWYASSLFMGGRMHFMNCLIVVCILSYYGREDAFHELSTREMHPLYLWKWGCISWTVNSWDASLYLWKGGCISWTVNSWDASTLFIEGRMHFMNCQLVRCILLIYGRENAFHELSTREMHPLYLWKVECISWTVYSWYASTLFIEVRMHFMNCQLVRCILSFYGR